MDKLQPMEFDDQRILTSKQLAEIYETTEGNISNNFNNNKNHFKEGKHYYFLKGEQLKQFLQSYEIGVQNPSKVRSLYVWTERGADRHCKILDTDKAWEQFDKLEDNYFRIKKFKPLTASQELKLHYQVLEEHGEEIKALKEDITDIKENSPLYNIECKELQDLVRKIGTKVLGGYRTPAYKNNSLRGKVYSDIQQQLRREFGVKRYEAIRRCQLNKAREIIENYKVPLVLNDKIILENNQLGFN